MVTYEITKNTLSSLETDVYAFKRRADLLGIATDYKLEGRLAEKWRDFYTHIYNCLDKISQLPYLISEKYFPESHYNWNGPKRIDPEYFEKKFKEIAILKDELIENAKIFDKAVKEDISVIASIRSDVTWEDWLDTLEEVGYEINSTTELFIISSNPRRN